MVDPSGLIRVRWVDCGRWSGKESYVSHRNILEERVLVGDTIRVRWGKSNRLYTAQVLDEDAIETVSNEHWIMHIRMYVHTYVYTVCIIHTYLWYADCWVGRDSYIVYIPYMRTYVHTLCTYLHTYVMCFWIFYECVYVRTYIRTYVRVYSIVVSNCVCTYVVCL